jgi:transposase
VIGATGAVRVIVATKPVDFRKGADGLAALVRGGIRADPFSGAVDVFRANQADRVKLVSGTAPASASSPSVSRTASSAGRRFQDGVIRLTAAQLSALLEDLDWRRVREAPETAPAMPS